MKLVRNFIFALGFIFPFSLSLAHEVNVIQCPKDISISIFTKLMKEGKYLYLDLKLENNSPYQLAMISQNLPWIISFSMTAYPLSDPDAPLSRVYPMFSRAGIIQIDPGGLIKEKVGVNNFFSNFNKVLRFDDIAVEWHYTPVFFIGSRKELVASYSESGMNKHIVCEKISRKIIIPKGIL